MSLFRNAAGRRQSGRSARARARRTAASAAFRCSPAQAAPACSCGCRDNRRTRPRLLKMTRTSCVSLTPPSSSCTSSGKRLQAQVHKVASASIRPARSLHSNSARFKSASDATLAPGLQDLFNPGSPRGDKIDKRVHKIDSNKTRDSHAWIGPQSCGKQAMGRSRLPGRDLFGSRRPAGGRRPGSTRLGSPPVLLPVEYRTGESGGGEYADPSHPTLPIAEIKRFNRRQQR